MTRPIVLCCAALGVYLSLSGLWWAWGTHDNDWPLLMWLAHNWSLKDPSPLLIGHYPPAQLLLVWTSPLNTLLTAKLFNVAATVASGAFVYGLARRHGADRALALAAFAVFALSAEALLSGQSEFADPLATCVFLAALYYAPSSLWVAGALLGLAGWCRLHMLFFGAGVAILLCWQHRKWAPLAGWIMVALPWLVLPHPVNAGMMLGQVIHGADAYDLSAPQHRVTFADAPEVARLMLQRVRECPKRFWPLIALLAWGMRQRHARFYALCAAGYFAAVVSPSYSVTTRLLLPLVALLALGCAATLAGGRRHQLAALGLIAFVAARVIIAWHAIPEELGRVADAWDASRQLTELLRDQGMHEPREAFVVDWRRTPTDTQALSAFYNFGFWNLMSPRYAQERPLPRVAGDLARHGVKWMVTSNLVSWQATGAATFIGARTTDSVFSVSSAAEGDGAVALQPSRRP